MLNLKKGDTKIDIVKYVSLKYATKISFSTTFKVLTSNQININNLKYKCIKSSEIHPDTFSFFNII